MEGKAGSDVRVGRRSLESTLGKRKEQGSSEQQNRSKAKLMCQRSVKRSRLTGPKQQDNCSGACFCILGGQGSTGLPSPLGKRGSNVTGGEIAVHARNGVPAWSRILWFEGCVRSLPNVGDIQIGSAKPSQTRTRRRNPGGEVLSLATGEEQSKLQMAVCRKGMECKRESTTTGGGSDEIVVLLVEIARASMSNSPAQVSPYQVPISPQGTGVGRVDFCLRRTLYVSRSTSETHLVAGT